MVAYLVFELRRLLRQPRLFILTVFMPVISYVVFTGVGDVSGRTEGVPVAVALMVGVGGYGAVIGVLSVGVAVSAERTVGWLRQLRVTPLRPLDVVVVKGFLATLTAIPSVIGVALAARFEHHVSLPVDRWVLLVLVMWLGSVPFALLGLALGYLLPPNIAQPASFLTFFSLSVLGGLLVPVAAFPRGLQRIAHALPTNRYAELGWATVGGHWPTAVGGTVLVAWTVGFALLAATAYRRSTATR
jgi:ABC-2 type transport system permease protein